jgi:hypothetical protein
MKTGNELHKIDTRGGKAPHKRHLATINIIRIPGFRPKAGEPGDVLEGQIAATRCGRFVRNYYLADDTSLLHTDGTEYSRECPVCFTEGV